MWQVVSGIALGWSLGSNDASNVFGTAVASHMVRFRTAALLCAGFVIIGAIVDGQAGMHTYQKLSPMTANSAFLVGVSAAVSVALMSFWSLPVSTSQAVVGAMVLVGYLRDTLNVSSLGKIFLCWVGTPIGAALITVVLYFVLGKILNRLYLNIFVYDRLMRWGLIAAGSYGAYALGANNVANVTGAFAGPGMLTPMAASVIGAGAIAVGVLTYSKNVMMTVGKNLVKLDAFTALVAILAEAITVHIYALVGVPVSTSQAIVGAVLGVGLLKGTQTINSKTLWLIAFGWVGTPAISATIALVLFYTFEAFGLL